MRTQDEIVAYLVELKNETFWQFYWEALAWYLDYEHAKPFLRPDVTQEEWDKLRRPLTEAEVVERMRDYMEHAWKKVEDHRGLSASVAVEKFRMWLWLLGDDELYAFASDDDNYAYYGAPILAAICRKYGFPMPTDERIVRMMQGQPCRPDCQEGCNEGVGDGLTIVLDID